MGEGQCAIRQKNTAHSCVNSVQQSHRQGSRPDTFRVDKSSEAIISSSAKLKQQNMRSSRDRNSLIKEGLNGLPEGKQMRTQDCLKEERKHHLVQSMISSKQAKFALDSTFSKREVSFDAKILN